ncbi:MAG TPA: helix-turn-helix transcriptional regulator, partial [Actinopolymorphaceae bacterium]
MVQTPTATRLQLGKELQALRLRAGMNTSGAAALLRLKQAGTIRRYERGEVTIPYPHLDLLLRTWNLTTDEERRVLEELRDQSDQPVWWSGLGLTE